jgi:branched-subunit amino acid transport protein
MMDNTIHLLWLFILCGLITFGIRYFWIGLEGQYQAPKWLKTTLPWVPICALSAMIAPDIAAQAKSAAVSYAPWIAAFSAAWVAWRYENVWFTVITGFGVLVLLNYFLVK